MGKLALNFQSPQVTLAGFFAFAGLRTTYTGLVPLGAAPATYTPATR